nr:hypothetical protein [Tanacetum cinerariifolium]
MNTTSSPPYHICCHTTTATNITTVVIPITPLPSHHPTQPPHQQQQGPFGFVLTAIQGCLAQPIRGCLVVKLLRVRLIVGLAAFGAFGYGFNTTEAALDLMAALGCGRLG